MRARATDTGTRRTTTWTHTLADERGVYRYKLVDGLVAQRTQAEMDADFDALPAPPLTTEERVNNVEQRTDALESANDDLILMMADLIGG